MNTYKTVITSCLIGIALLWFLLFGLASVLRYQSVMDAKNEILIDEIQHGKCVVVSVTSAEQGGGAQ